MAGHDGLIHLAGDYRVGIAPAERPAMFAANVTATARVLDAAIDAGVARIVDVSTANVFGDTHGRVVDETYRRDPADGFLAGTTRRRSPPTSWPLNGSPVEPRS